MDTTLEILLKIIEQYGPIIIIVISILKLFIKQNYIFFYLIGTAINEILNLFLKYTIKENRPSISEKQNKIFTLGHQYDYFYSVDKYGMPSGHAQNLGFSLGFMFMFIKHSYLLWVYIIISCITLFQRYINKKHSIIQLFIGYSIGMIIGILFYKLGNHFIKGNVYKKKEDNAYII
jgi:membrane-associated phospholipid phosphatase